MGTEENGHLKIFEPETPVLWYSASTNCATTRPLHIGTVHTQELINTTVELCVYEQFNIVLKKPDF
jgi:hypothetical protein